MVMPISGQVQSKHEARLELHRSDLRQRTAECFDPSSGRWLTLPPMQERSDAAQGHEWPIRLLCTCQALQCRCGGGPHLEKKLALPLI